MLSRLKSTIKGALGLVRGRSEPASKPMGTPPARAAAPPPSAPVAKPAAAAPAAPKAPAQAAPPSASAVASAPAVKPVAAPVEAPVEAQVKATAPAPVEAAPVEAAPAAAETASKGKKKPKADTAKAEAAPAEPAKAEPPKAEPAKSAAPEAPKKLSIAERAAMAAKGAPAPAPAAEPAPADRVDDEAHHEKQRKQLEEYLASKAASGGKKPLQADTFSTDKASYILRAKANGRDPATFVVGEEGLNKLGDGTQFWGPVNNSSSRAKAEGKVLTIDQFECISCGTCVEQTEHVFYLPADGKATPIAQDGPMDLIEDAIEACPVTCITWTTQEEAEERGLATGAEAG